MGHIIHVNLSNISNQIIEINEGGRERDKERGREREKKKAKGRKRKSLNCAISSTIKDYICMYIYIQCEATLGLYCLY